MGQRHGYGRRLTNDGRAPDRYPDPVCDLRVESTAGGFEGMVGVGRRRRHPRSFTGGGCQLERSPRHHGNFDKSDEHHKDERDDENEFEGG